MNDREQRRATFEVSAADAQPPAPSGRGPGHSSRLTRGLPFVLLVLCFPLLGSRTDCDPRPPTLTCGTFTIMVERGSCALFQNPCDSGWIDNDAFELSEPPAGLSVVTTRNRQGTTRELCASQNLATFSDLVPFVYDVTVAIGEGEVNVVTVEDPLQVVASATPSTIQPGASSQLFADVSGGVAPYSYSWSPASSLDDASLVNPTASPASATTYAVTVTDSRGAIDTDTVTVSVGFAVTASANPSTLSVGFSSQLDAVISGAIPPLTYAWSPAVLVSNPSIRNPIAFPAASTTFTVDVTDVSGTTVAAGVDITVLLRTHASAIPAVLLEGETTQLIANAAGGSPPYQYLWTESGGGATVSDPGIAAPLADPIVTTTYTVTVTDSVSTQVQQDVTVTVQPANTPLAACFTVTPDPPPAVGQVTFDFSCSTGNIVNFELWRNWIGDPQQLPSFAGSSTSVSFFNELAGSTIARLRVTDSSGEQAVTEAQVIYQ